MHEQCLLRDAVRRVGLFGVTVPQRLFAEGDRRELRIAAHRSEHDGLVHVAPPRRLDDVGAHHEVVEVQGCGFDHVVTDAPDSGREVHDVRRGVFGEQSIGDSGSGEVGVAATRSDDRCTPAPERLDDVATEESVASGDENGA
jgi:hypothetical protein